MKITTVQVGARVEVLIEGACPALNYPAGTYIAAADDGFSELIAAGEKLANDARVAQRASVSR